MLQNIYYFGNFFLFPLCKKGLNYNCILLSFRPQSSVCRRPCSSWKGEQTETSPPRTQAPPKKERERLWGGEGRWQGIPHLWLETHSTQIYQCPHLLTLLFIFLSPLNRSPSCSEYLLLRAFSYVYSSLTGLTSDNKQKPLQYTIDSPGLDFV